MKRHHLFNQHLLGVRYGKNLDTLTTGRKDTL